MPEHKFKIGQLLFPVPSTAKKLPGGVYVVIKRLPKRDNEFEYQIKNLNGSHDCIVYESQLRTNPSRHRSRHDSFS